MSAVRVSTVVLVAVTLLTAGCADGGHAGSPAGATTPVLRLPARPVKPAQPKPASADRFASGLPPQGATAPAPPAPDTIAALAKASIPLVVGVHNVASSAGRPLGLPAGALRSQATDARSRLVQLSSQLGRGSDRARVSLATILTGYIGIATQLARREGPLRPPSQARLASLDLQWRGALREIGRRSGSDIIASVPSLPSPDVPAPALRPRRAR